MHRVGLILALIVAALTPSLAQAEAIEYEVYELRNNGERTLLASGVKNYAVTDVHVEERVASAGGRFWSKSILVWDDFSVGASVHRESSLEGFGLWITKGGDGFSWDWFNREGPDTFRKLQGKGLVRVRTVSSASYQELTAVEFLTDVTLRGEFSWWPFSTADTHHLVVKKGSVLRVAP